MKKKVKKELSFKIVMDVIRLMRISCDGFVIVFSSYNLEYTCCVYDFVTFIFISRPYKYGRSRN